MKFLSCSPIESSSGTDTATTASSASTLGYGDTNFATVSLNAVNVFQPMGISPIPTDIQLAAYNDDPLGDEFQTCNDQNQSFDRDNPISLDCLPPDNISDPYDDTEDTADCLRGNLDTGTTVSCTNR